MVGKILNHSHSAGLTEQFLSTFHTLKGGHCLQHLMFRPTELIGQGMENLTKWWLVFFPLGATFVTLLLIVFIGEAVREAFDPKEYSRLR